MQMCPGWCDNYKDYWAAIVGEWTTDVAYQRHRECREGACRCEGHHTTKGTSPSQCSWKDGYASIDLLILALNCHYL